MSVTELGPYTPTSSGVLRTDLNGGSLQELSYTFKGKDTYGWRTLENEVVPGV